MSNAKEGKNVADTNVTLGEEDVTDKLWMLRPCELYHDEYKDCSSSSGKFHEKFVFGEPKTARCQQWLADYENCVKYRKTRHLYYAECIIQNEMARREERLEAAKANNVWQYRSSPPSDWNAPLPEHLEKKKLPDLTKAYENRNACSIS